MKLTIFGLTSTETLDVPSIHVLHSNKENWNNADSQSLHESCSQSTHLGNQDSENPRALF